METLGTVCRGSLGHTKNGKSVSWVQVCLALGWWSAQPLQRCQQDGRCSLLALQSHLCARAAWHSLEIHRAGELLFCFGSPCPQCKTIETVGPYRQYFNLSGQLIHFVTQVELRELVFLLRAHFQYVCLILGSHRNPSTAFYQAFNFNKLHESKASWDRYGCLSMECIHAEVCMNCFALCEFLIVCVCTQLLPVNSTLGFCSLNRWKWSWKWNICAETWN